MEVFRIRGILLTSFFALEIIFLFSKDVDANVLYEPQGDLNQRNHRVQFPTRYMIDRARFLASYILLTIRYSYVERLV